MASKKSGPSINKLVDSVTDKAGKVASGTASAVTSRIKALSKNPARRGISQVLYNIGRGAKVSGERVTKGPKRSR